MRKKSKGEGSMTNSREERPAGRAERGTSLLEVLIAMLLLLVLMISILQMFAASFMVNGAAGARTEMTYRVQQVVEQLRYLEWLQRANATAYGNLNTATPVGVAIPMTSGNTYNLTDLVIADPDTSFWGPAGCRIVEEQVPGGAVKPPYFLTVTTAAGAGGAIVVTVRARPNPKPGETGNDPNYSNFTGLGMGRKAVEYVEQINP
jgi:hypothetical protein